MTLKLLSILFHNTLTVIADIIVILVPLDFGLYSDELEYDIPCSRKRINMDVIK